MRTRCLVLGILLMLLGLAVLVALVGCSRTTITQDQRQELIGKLGADLEKLAEETRWHVAEATCEVNKGFWLAWRVGDKLRGRCVEVWTF